MPLAMLAITLACWSSLAAERGGEAVQDEGALRVRVESVSSELDGGTGGVSVDREGNVYVADFGALLDDRATMGRKIFRLTPDGRADIFARGFEGASGNEFDANGFLYQSNIRGNYVSRVAPDGTHNVFVRERIDAPVGIVIDEDGVLYVANCGSASVLRVAPDGSSQPFVQSDLLKCPNGITLDDEHNLYVANFNNGDVVKITPTREVTRLGTLPGNNNGHLTYHEGLLYVVARSDHRIYQVTLDGEATPFAGTGERGRRDGEAASARFSYPNDIAWNAPERAFYVNEIASTTSDASELSPMAVRRVRLAP
jgi:sugar lactone lactonase YvrE